MCKRDRAGICARDRRRRRGGMRGRGKAEGGRREVDEGRGRGEEQDEEEDREGVLVGFQVLWRGLWSMFVSPTPTGPPAVHGWI